MQTTWFWLLCALWSLYFLTEGFDFGVGMLLPILGRSEDDRGTMIRAIGPFWDGNEVWLIIAGAATFAAFPVWYATMFSGFYIALLLLLVLLIVRVISFEWRGKAESPGWRSVWAWLNTTAAFGIPLIWGIALSSLLHGVPISSEQEFTGSIWDLFTPYTVVAGIAFVLLFALHGGVYLTLRTTGELHARAVRTAARLAVPGRNRGRRLPRLDARGRDRQRTTRTSSPASSSSSSRAAPPWRRWFSPVDAAKASRSRRPPRRSCSRWCSCSPSSTPA